MNDYLVIETNSGYAVGIRFETSYLFQNEIKPFIQGIVVRMGLNPSDFSDTELIELKSDWNL